MSKQPAPYFPIGSSYYPPFHAPEDWVRDVENMKKAGFNMIRTAELLSSWDYIEPRRGQPEWDWLDRIFELCGESELQIVLGTGSCNPPIWMMDQYPDLQRVSREGTRYPLNTVWGWACVNNPGLRNEVTRYLTLLLERYSQNPVLYCWQIDNQIGHHTAFTEAEHTHPRRNAYWCYCDHCARLFREWVQARYQDIEALNHAWTWDPTHYRYYDWHQIRPPRSLPAEWGNGTAWLDFRVFVKESIASFVQFQHDLIKSYDPDQLTMHNLYDCLRVDLGARNEPNHWDIGGIPDIIGHDIYPSENNFKKDPAFTSWFLDFAYSVAHHNERTMWIPELESGPIGGFSAGPNFATRPLDIKRFNIACIGHGAKALLYQGYRDWNSIPLTWGALVDFHGQPTGRYHAAAEVARVVHANQDFFLHALPPRAQVALFHTYENVILLDGQANESLLYKALRGAHTALWQNGYTIQFVEARFLGAASAAHKVILLPFLMHLPQAHAEKLAQFVQRGGILVGCAKLGHVDEKGWAWNDRPGAGLDRLFGARETHIEVFREPDEAIRLRVDPASPLFPGVEAETVQGYWHRQEFAIEPDVEVLARFVDGQPAVLSRQVGQGRAILMGTHLDMAYQEYAEPQLKLLWRNLMAYCGVTRDIQLSGADQEYVESRIDAHLLQYGDQAAVLINNEGLQDAEVRICIPELPQAASAVELFSDRALDLSSEEGARFSLHLPAADGAMVMLESRRGN